MRVNRTDARTMLGALEDQAKRQPDARFVIGPDRTLSFSEFRERAVDVASGLRDLGLQPGDRVAVVSVNRVETVEVYFAAAYAGLLSVPINVHLRGAFLRHQLLDSATTVVVADKTGIEILQPVLDQLPDLRTIVRLDPESEIHGFHGRTVDYAELGTGHPEIQMPDARPNDPFQIIYTGGTTGPSKGAVQSQRYMVRVGTAIADILRVSDSDVAMTVAPFFHMSGQINLAVALVCGIPIVVESDFTARGFFPRARETGATIAVAVGAVFKYLLALPPQPDDLENPMRAVLGVPMTAAMVADLKTRFGIDAIGEMYAQSEAVPVSCGVLGTLPLTSDSGYSGGVVLPDLDVAIVDEDDTPVDVGTVGEIVVRPREPGAIFSGYWNNSAGTVELWRNLWHHTGDRGRLDDSGILWYVERKRDSMRRRGNNVSAFELEQAVLSFPGVVEAAAIAAKVEGELEDEIKVCLVLEPDQVLDVEKFAGYCVASLPYFAVPRFIEVLDEMPKSHLGRIQKFILRERPVMGPTTRDLVSEGLATGRKTQAHSGGEA